MIFRSEKLLKSAKDKPCVLCQRNDGTTVACHIRRVAFGAGTGLKPPDCLTAWLCKDCHDKLDDREKFWDAAQRDQYWLLAYGRTVVQWFEQRIVIVK